MNDMVKEPGVPFPLAGAATGPETPFPLKTVEDTLCRDCPFPMQPAWPKDVMHAWTNWQKDFLKTLQAKAPADAGVPYGELIGKTLEVVRPDGPGAKFIGDPNRIVISVDEHDRIQHVTPPNALFPDPIVIPEGSIQLGGE